MGDDCLSTDEVLHRRKCVYAYALAVSTMNVIKSVNIFCDEYVTQSDVKSNQTEELADFVRRVLSEKDLSHRQVAEKAKAKGHSLDASHVSKIVSRITTDPKPKTLQALAAGLGVEDEEIFAIVRGETPDKNKINDALMNSLAFDYGRLTKKDKEALTPLLRALQREVEERLEKLSDSKD